MSAVAVALAPDEVPATALAGLQPVEVVEVVVLPYAECPECRAATLLIVTRGPDGEEEHDRCSACAWAAE